MVSTYKLHQQYIRLYREFRRFIWNWDTVYALAELETEVFQAFPDLNCIRKILEELGRCVKDVQVNDEWLTGELVAMQNLVTDNTDVYLKLKSVREVVR